MENVTGQYKMTDITPDQIEKIFQKKVLVLEFHVGMWSYKKPSDKMIKITAEKTGVSADYLTGQVLAADRKYFKPLERLVSDFRTFVSEQTLINPESANFTLPVANYEIIDNEIRKFSIDFEKLVGDIARQFEDIKDEARRFLNGNYEQTLFDEKFYPPVEKLVGDKIIHRQGEQNVKHGKYYFEYRFKPYAVAGSLQADLVNESLQDLKKIMQSETQEDFKRVISDIWQRIFDATSKLKETMKKPDRQDKDGAFQAPIFRDSIIGNIKELVNIIPSLNIFEDPAIDQARSELIQELCQLDPQELRDNKEKRQEAEQKADKILNKLPGMFGN